MSHGFEMQPAAKPPVPVNAVLAAVAGLLDKYNKVAVFLAMIALLLTSVILTYSVVVRYFFHHPTD